MCRRSSWLETVLWRRFYVLSSCMVFLLFIPIPYGRHAGWISLHLQIVPCIWSSPWNVARLFVGAQVQTSLVEGWCRSCNDRLKLRRDCQRAMPGPKWTTLQAIGLDSKKVKLYILFQQVIWVMDNSVSTETLNSLCLGSLAGIILSVESVASPHKSQSTFIPISNSIRQR